MNQKLWKFPQTRVLYMSEGAAVHLKAPLKFAANHMEKKKMSEKKGFVVW